MGRISKDDKLIQENPQARPYELLNMGLSQTKYDELVKTRGEALLTDKAEQMQKAKERVEQLQPIKAMPVVTPVIQSGRAYLYDKKNGKATPMDRVAATRWAQKYPEQYTVK